MRGKSQRIETLIAPGASAALPRYCAQHNYRLLHIVADSNTWDALGADIKAQAEAAGLQTEYTVFEASSAPLAADGASILHLLLDIGGRKRLLAAAGSGTITDITRFAASRCGLDFVSLPTAPSVDAYASVVAPLIVDGVKRTVGAQAPLAIFADTDILCAAPRPMISAGFGDVIGKYCSVADWRLGALFWDEDFDAGIAARATASADACARAAADIGAAREKGISILIESLIESGKCMAEAGNSHPASGAEHQYSHYWEMKLLREGRPPLLHGLKVGVGAVLASELWERIRALPPSAAAGLLEVSEAPSLSYERAAIERAYGRDAAAVESSHKRILELEDSSKAYHDFCTKISDNWDKVRKIAADVPSAAEMSELLRTAGCPTEPAGLGLGRAEAAAAEESAHYIRDRFTVRKLARMLWGD